MPSTGTDLHARWLDGLELSFAWRVMPCEDLQAQYQASGDNLAHRESVIVLMKLELANRLLNGEYVAIGVKTAPGSDANLELIPAHFFARRDAVDWDGSTVRVH